MKRLVGYIRQSLQDAASSSPERQAEIIETWAQSRDLVITRIYEGYWRQAQRGYQCQDP